MRAQSVLLFFLFPAMLLCGCAGQQAALPLGLDSGKKDRAQVRIPDPAGPIAKPRLPASLAAASGQPVQAGAETPAASISYTVTTGTRPGPEEPALDDTTFQIWSKRVEQSFHATATLYRLRDKPPDSLASLEQRLSVSLKEGGDVLRSLGFYAGRARGRVVSAQRDAKGNIQAAVEVTLFLGPQYHVSKSPVFAPLPSNAPDPGGMLPQSLAEAGLAEAAPAVAADILAAVDRSLEMFENNGYPFAFVANTRYIVDHDARALEAYVSISPGAFARMGNINRQGAESVEESYITALQTWEKGRPWSRSTLESFREALRQSGLFQSIEVSPAPEDSPEGNRDIVTSLESAPERTVGGALKYHSDFGPGLQAYWEHRNLTGKGDRLRLAMPLWADMQELTAQYRRPFYLRRDQDFIANAGAIHQDTDAYRLSAGSVSAGVERRLSRYWSASLLGSVEGGSIKEPDMDKQEYLMFGLPFSLAYDNTGSLLDAVKGRRLLLSLAPYTGSYHNSFTIVRTRADLYSFIPLVGEDKLVLALRGSIGAISGADSEDVPPSVRFYSGGGGSVRGYEYQSLGPRNEDNDPLGGGSLVEASLETRWKITPEWGLVAFVDGGTVYKDMFSDTGQTIRWGAGAGFRYYTAIGPIRFDVATPLNPREDDKKLQIYISIGQSF